MKNNKIKRVATQIISTGTLILGSIVPVHANNAIMESTWFTGGVQLVKDATSAGLLIFPLIGIFFSMYFWARRGIAEPEEKKRWQDRAVNAMLIGVIVGLISGLVSLLTSYIA